MEYPKETSLLRERVKPPPSLRIPAISIGSPSQTPTPFQMPQKNSQIPRPQDAPYYNNPIEKFENTFRDALSISLMKFRSSIHTETFISQNYQYQSNAQYDRMIDTCIDNLVDEINEIVPNVTFPNYNLQQIENCFNEGTRPIQKMFRDHRDLQLKNNQKRSRSLEKLLESIKNLHSVVNSIQTSINTELRSYLNKERDHTEDVISRVSETKRQLKRLKSKYTMIQSANERMKAESDQIAEMISDLDQKIASTNQMNVTNRSGTSISPIMKEIQDIKFMLIQTPSDISNQITMISNRLKAYNKAAQSDVEQAETDISILTAARAPVFMTPQPPRVYRLFS